MPGPAMTAGKGMHRTTKKIEQTSYTTKAYLLSIAVHGLMIVLMSVLGGHRALRKWNDFAEIAFVSAEAAAPIRPVKQETVLPKSEPVPRQETVKLKAPREAEKKERPPADAGAGSRVKVAVERFPFDYYLRLLRNRLQDNWQPPYQSGPSGRMSAVVTFTIRRNGEITGITVTRSSGKFLFDAAAQRAVTAAGRMPPLPDEYGEDELQVTIDFEATW